MFFVHAQSGLRLKLKEVSSKLEWLESMDVTSPLRTLEKKSSISSTKRKLRIRPATLDETRNEDGEEAVDAEDDFKREMHL